MIVFQATHLDYRMGDRYRRILWSLRSSYPGVVGTPQDKLSQNKWKVNTQCFFPVSTKIYPHSHTETHHTYTHAYAHKHTQTHTIWTHIIAHININRKKENRVFYATFVMKSSLQYYTKAEIRERNINCPLTIRVYTVKLRQELAEAEWNTALRQDGNFPWWIWIQ